MSLIDTSALWKPAACWYVWNMNTPPLAHPLNHAPIPHIFCIFFMCTLCTNVLATLFYTHNEFLRISLELVITVIREKGKGYWLAHRTGQQWLVSSWSRSFCFVLGCVSCAALTNIGMNSILIVASSRISHRSRSPELTCKRTSSITMVPVDRSFFFWSRDHLIKIHKLLVLQPQHNTTVSSFIWTDICQPCSFAIQFHFLLCDSIFSYLWVKHRFYLSDHTLLHISWLWFVSSAFYLGIYHLQLQLHIFDIYIS